MELLQKLNYYGFEKKIYDDCRGMINRTNQGHARIINIWFALINAFYLFCAWLELLNVDTTRKSFFLVFILMPFAIYYLAVSRGQVHPAFAIAGTVLDLGMFELYSVLSSNAEPYTVSWIFLILMIVVALSYIETMARMSVILFTLSAVFCRFSYLNKPHSIASMDLSNTVVVASLALVLHFAFQRARLSQFVTTLHDIRTQRELEISSSFDALTSLLNRGKFFSMSNLVLKDRADEYMALALMDLDGFKQINDQFGHQTGDRAIRLAADAIRETLAMELTDQWAFPEQALNEKRSFAGRLGGDEFILFLRGFEDREEILKQVYQITDALHAVHEGELHCLRASVGVTEIPAGETTLKAAYKRADDALYESKRNGKDQVNINCE